MLLQGHEYSLVFISITQIYPILREREKQIFANSCAKTFLGAVNTFNLDVTFL